MGKRCLLVIDLLLKFLNIILTVFDLLVKHRQIHVGLPQLGDIFIVLINGAHITALVGLLLQLWHLLCLRQCISIILKQRLSLLHAVARRNLYLPDLHGHRRKIRLCFLTLHRTACTEILLHIFDCYRHCGHHYAHILCRDRIPYHKEHNHYQDAADDTTPYNLLFPLFIHRFLRRFFLPVCGRRICFCYTFHDWSCICQFLFCLTHCPLSSLYKYICASSAQTVSTCKVSQTLSW